MTSKKYETMRTFLFLMLSTLSFQLHSQGIERGDFAFQLFQDIYPNGTAPTDFEAGFFPTPFLDNEQGTPLNYYIKIFSFLEFGDGIPAFDRESTSFRVDEEMSRAEIIKIIIEAYDIPLNTSGGLPYGDYNDPDDIYYKQVLTAYNLGVLPSGSILNPQGYASSGFANDLMNDVSAISSPSIFSLYNTANYFKPFNISPLTAGIFQNIEQGGFSHYAKNSFVIPDRKMNLDFSHFYSNMMVEIPGDFYPIKPLGRGWSHTYNSYIIREDNVGLASIDYYHIVWPDGTIHVFDEDDNEYITQGIYDDLDELNNDVIRITKKNQTRYYYEKLDNGRPIYYLYRITDPNGNQINIEYESAEENDTKRIEWVEAPSGKRLEFEYMNGYDLIDKIIDPINRNIEFEYSGLSAGWVYQYPVLTVFEDAKNQLTTYSYGINNPYDIHLLNRIQLPEGNLITADYTGNGKLSEYQINNDDPVLVDLDFDYSNQDFLSEVEVPTEGNNINTQEFEFNNYGSVTNYLDDNNSISIDYPSSGVNVLLPINSNMNGVDIDYDYDSRGNVTEIDKENGAVVEYFIYNSDNTLKQYVDPNGNVTKLFYDNDLNLIEIEDPLDNSSYFTYDNYGQLLTSTNQEGIQTTYTYENDGAVSTIDMPENISYSFLYDGVNRLTQKNDNGLISSYTYDPNDNLTSQTNSGGFTTSYDYDANDNLTEIVNANTISIEFEYDEEDRVIEETFGNLVKEYEYGDEGFLEEYTKPSGIQIDYQYDNDGRLEETGTVTDIDYNNRNLMESITTNAGTTELDYNYLNRLTEVTTVHGTELEYIYDDVGNVARIYYPSVNGNSFHVRYYYDEKNRISEVWASANGQLTTVVEYQYRDDDLIESVEYANGIIGNYAYDGAGRKTGITYTYATGVYTGDTLFANNVQLDNRGNITEDRRYYQSGSTGTSYSIADKLYGYDDNNHIEYAGNVDIDIDQDGNTELKEGFSGTFNFIYEFDKDDQLIEIDRSDAPSCFPYQYEYNGFGNQVAETAYPNGTGSTPARQLYTWDIVNNNMLFEMTENAPSSGRYHVYGVTGLEITVRFENGDAKNTYHIGDLRGSVITRVQDDNTFSTNPVKYDDFGKQMGVGGANAPCDYQDEYAYLGKHGVRKSKGGLYYVKARYYDPEIGRFLSEDPVWSTNLYPYAENNPISKIDPDGRFSLDLNDLLSGADNILDYISANMNIGDNGKIYIRKESGRIFNGNQYVKVKGMSLGTLGELLKKANHLSNVGNIASAFKKDGGVVGYNTKMELVGLLGDFIGSRLGGYAGGALGSLASPIGTFIGATVGTIVGGKIMRDRFQEIYSQHYYSNY